MLGKKTKNILVIGNFDILHPGHIRLLKFAKECGTTLIVAVNSDDNMAVKSKVQQKHRLEIVHSLECVDKAFLTDESPTKIIDRLRPYAVVKGKEFESRDNPEQMILDSYGGKLIFGSGEFETNSEQYVKQTKSEYTNFDFSGAQGYVKRHNLNIQDLNNTLDAFSKLRVAVIGEIIVDEYIQGTAVGMSQEDPTIVMTPEKSDIFIGGAAITAGHIKSLGANNVMLFSILGEDDKALYVKNHIHDYGIETCFYQDPSRPTPLKTRYNASNKTLLRVNQVRQHKISLELQTKLFEQIKGVISNIDLMIFSDFNYGVLPQSLVEKISQLCHENNVKIVADSQTSSQVGDISRYNNMKLLTPTEKEVRVALNNAYDGLVVLADKLFKKSNPENLVITLAGDGIFIHIPERDKKVWINDTLPAFNKNAVDPAGAGDCFLAVSSLALCSGSTPWSAFFLANLAAACQVSVMGNKPLLLKTLKQNLDKAIKE